MKKNSIIVILILAFSQLSLGQVGTFTKILGESGKDEKAHSVIQHPTSGDFFITGSTQRAGNGKDMFIMKISEDGEFKASSTVYFGGTDHDEGMRLYFDSQDDNYIYILGNTYTATSGNDKRKAFLVKYKISTESVEWQRFFNGYDSSPKYYNKKAIDLVQKNNYLVVLCQNGVRDPDTDEKHVDFSLAKVDKSTGALVKMEETQTYSGGTSKKEIYWGDSDENDGAARLLQITTGDYAAVGSWGIAGTYNHATIVKFNKQLNHSLTWERNEWTLSANSAKDIRFYNAEETSNSFMAIGYCDDNTLAENKFLYAQEFDSDIKSGSDVICLGSNGAGSNKRHEEGTCIIESGDDYIMVGNSEGTGSGGSSYVFFASYSHTNDQLNWVRKIEDICEDKIDNSWSEPKTTNLISTADGGYLFVGSVNNTGESDRNILILKVDADFENGDCLLADDGDFIKELNFQFDDDDNNLETMTKTENDDIYESGLISYASALVSCNIKCADWLQCHQVKQPCDNSAIEYHAHSFIDVDAINIYDDIESIQFQQYASGLWWSLASGPVLKLDDNRAGGTVEYRLVIETLDGCQAVIYFDITTPYQGPPPGEENYVNVRFEETEHLKSVQLFPNPVNDELYIDLSEAAMKVTIINAQGQVVGNIDHMIEGRNVVNTSRMTPGSYLVRVQLLNETKTLPFIKN